MIRVLFAVVALSLLLPACRVEETKASPGEQDPSVYQPLHITGDDGAVHVFRVEIADTPEKRTIGLMFRDAIPPDAGMLFVFDGEEAEQSFWMKNTFIPLDLIFIRGDGVIRHIHENAVPHDLTGLPSRGPVRAVLEINGGRAKALNLRPGHVVNHPALTVNSLAE